MTGLQETRLPDLGQNTLRVFWIPCFLLIVVLVTGCSSSGSSKTQDDQPAAEPAITAEQLAFNFVDSQGQQFRLADYEGKKNVVLVFMRGWAGFVCPYCVAQTSRLIQRRKELEDRDAQVLLVYPGSKERVSEFVSQAQKSGQGQEFPFPILLDVDAKIVRKLRIDADLAKPSTFILDKQGRRRFIKVGRTTADRPSLETILEELDKIQESQATQAKQGPPDDNKQRSKDQPVQEQKRQAEHSTATPEGSNPKFGGAAGTADLRSAPLQSKTVREVTA